jgi:hypothetical protein
LTAVALSDSGNLTMVNLASFAVLLLAVSILPLVSLVLRRLRQRSLWSVPGPASISYISGERLVYFASIMNTFIFYSRESESLVWTRCTPIAREDDARLRQDFPLDWFSGCAFLLLF